MGHADIGHESNHIQHFPSLLSPHGVPTSPIWADIIRCR